MEQENKEKLTKRVLNTPPPSPEMSYQMPALNDRWLHQYQERPHQNISSQKIQPCFSLAFTSHHSFHYKLSQNSQTNKYQTFRETLTHISEKPSTAMDTREESVKRLMKLKLLLTKLQRGFFFSSSRKNDLSDIDEGEKMVPNDVKKGHFAVIAVKGREPKRFIVELANLSNPEFLSLLEQAKEEYGFQQNGVIAVPCFPEELQNVISSKRKKRMSTEW